MFYMMKSKVEVYIPRAAEQQFQFLNRPSNETLSTHMIRLSTYRHKSDDLVSCTALVWRPAIHIFTFAVSAPMIHSPWKGNRPSWPHGHRWCVETILDRRFRRRSASPVSRLCAISHYLYHREHSLLLRTIRKNKNFKYNRIEIETCAYYLHWSRITTKIVKILFIVAVKTILMSLIFCVCWAKSNGQRRLYRLSAVFQKRRLFTSRIWCNKLTSTIGPMSHVFLSVWRVCMLRLSHSRCLLLPHFIILVYITLCRWYDRIDTHRFHRSMCESETSWREFLVISCRNWCDYVKCLWFVIIFAYVCICGETSLANLQIYQTS